ncbi:MAG: type II toxin-antitoxin system HicB family antitoxin [Candidatus Zixiibacteriota bacterium]
MRTFTAYVEYDPATGLYVGTAPGLRGAHTQAGSLDELQLNLREVVTLCLEELGEDVDAAALPHFVGLQTVEVEV